MIILYFLLMMLPIVIIHELGHFYIGRWSGIRPEVFSVGFGPELAAKKRKDGTTWRLAAFPLGGYVKFASDANGTHFPNLETDKPPYQASYGAKVATLLAGPFANFTFSIILFLLYATIYGLQTDRPVVETIHFVESPLERGDEILAVNGQPVASLGEIYEAAGLEEALVQARISRGGEEMEIAIPSPNLAVVMGLDPKLPALGAGIEIGDQITAYGGVDVISTSDLVEAIGASGFRAAEIDVLRDGERLTLSVTPGQFEMETGEIVPRLGVMFGGYYEMAHERLGFGDALRYSLSSTVWILQASYEGIRDLVTGAIGIEAMSGPVGIGEVATQSAQNGVWSFIWMMAVMSSAIGFLNLLPIPILDGGHLVFITYERIVGKLPPQSLLNALFMIGFGLLMSLMVITTIRDLWG